MSEEILRGEWITKSFPDGREMRLIMEDVHIAVEKGEMVGIMGPSGSGKTTLLSILSGLLPPDFGTVHLAGEELDYGKPREVARLRLTHVGYIFQSFRLIPEESIFSNVALPLLFARPRPSRGEQKRAVEEALHKAALDLPPRMRVAQLSQGERQRVAIARALVKKPSLLVADEPTASLDQATAGRIIELFQKIAGEGVGVLVATHDPQVAKACRRIYRFEGPHLRLLEEEERLALG